jgi:hypothetical protein
VGVEAGLDRHGPAALAMAMERDFEEDSNLLSDA